MCGNGASEQSEAQSNVLLGSFPNPIMNHQRVPRFHVRGSRLCTAAAAGSSSTASSTGPTRENTSQSHHSRAVLSVQLLLLETQGTMLLSVALRRSAALRRVLSASSGGIRSYYASTAVSADALDMADSFSRRHRKSFFH